MSVMRDRSACRPYRAPKEPRRARLALIIALLLAINVAVVLYHGDPRQKGRPAAVRSERARQASAVAQDVPAGGMPAVVTPAPPALAEVPTAASAQAAAQAQATAPSGPPPAPRAKPSAAPKEAPLARPDALAPAARSGQDRPLLPAAPAAAARGIARTEAPHDAAEAGGVRRRLRLVLGAGESATATLLAAGVRAGDVVMASESLWGRVDFRRLHPGDALVAHLDADGHLQVLEVQPKGAAPAVVRRGPKGWPTGRRRAELRSHTVDVERWPRRPTTLAGALAEVGEAPALADRLADIFTATWSTGPTLPMAAGDGLRVRVDKRFDGEAFVGYGPVHAAELTLAGEVHRAFRFTDNAGQPAYYDAEGRPWAHAFLALPLSAAAISSRYGQRRHPISGVHHHHNGIDYAVPAGTAVWTVGDGEVVFAGWQGGFGRLVEVRHAHGWLSQYAHLQEFAVRRGQRVRRGQVVGRVGQSGAATGPHLHFGLKRNGVFMDAARPPDAGFALGGSQLGRFREAQARGLLALSRPASGLAGP